MKKFGLIGEVLSYSFSPFIHEAFFAGQKMEAQYDLVEVAKGDFDANIRSILEGYDGVNITIPYKNMVMPFLDELDELSRQIGAVNTVHNENGKLTGYNTDAHGFLDMLDKFQVPIEDARYVILGTGGASKSVYYGLKTRNVGSIGFISRSQKSDWIQGEEIWTYDTYTPGVADVIVNTTPVGMASKENRSPIDASCLEGATHVVDIIYNPERTPLLRQAEEMGLAVVNGLYMLVSQGIKSEEIWNGVEASGEEKDRIYENLRELMIK